MAAAAASFSQRRYDVFLSFRGEDTRNNFTAHLDKELRAQGIDSFIIEEKLERGKAISSTLVAAIENSKLIMQLCFKYGKNESLLIQEIVKDILNKSLSTSIDDTKNPVGIGARIQEMEMQLCLESNDVQMVEIWGVGRTGKTTITKAIYRKISSQFEACSFFEKVKEELAKEGLIRLQHKFLSQLLEEENLNMKDSHG
uniref:TIR domain-containing protein n=1 Tax=Vitis vinifera TaxID=29760 RepID=A5AJV5_VITVI|nr:hypothetical protein VITISV_034308 [Vitis vinifera]